MREENYKKESINLPKQPVDRDYEDAISAYLLLCGFYVERNVIRRELEELFELDIILTEFDTNTSARILVEIKSKNWGFGDLFKMRGWMSFLGIERALLVSLLQKSKSDFYRSKSKEIGVALFDDCQLDKLDTVFAPLMRLKPSPIAAEMLTFAFMLERKLFADLKNKKKLPGHECLERLDSYLHVVCSDSFFESDATSRINRLFEVFLNERNLTARLSYELDKLEGVVKQESIKRNVFDSIFYKAEYSVFHSALLAEHLARVTILKSITEVCISDLKECLPAKGFRHLTIPSNLRAGIEKIKQDKFFHLYPQFWQCYTYIFGGFILSDLKEKEYELLSNLTGIPVEEIPKAFNVFDLLFPMDGPWQRLIPNTTIERHMLFPPVLSGIGVNFRRAIYTGSDDFNELFSLLAGSRTSSELSKWTLLVFEVLSKK